MSPPHRNPSQRSTSNTRLPRNKPKELCLHASYLRLEFRILQKDQRPKKIMTKYSALTLIMAVAVCMSQVAQAQGNKEANKLARDGAEASKSQDYDKAVELLRKATALDRKYAADLAVAYQQRGFASANAQKFRMPSPISPKRSKSIHETRAFTNNAQQWR